MPLRSSPSSSTAACSTWPQGRASPPGSSRPVPWVRQMTNLLDRYERLAPREDMEGWRPAFDRTGLFTPLRQRSFRHEQVLDDLVDRVSSMSFVIVMPADERARLLAEIDALV